MPIGKLKNAPPDFLRDRFLLVTIILSVWGFIKVLEAILPDKWLDYLPGPMPLALLLVYASMMTTYMVVIYVAQKWKEGIKKKHINCLSSSCPSVDIFIAAHNEETVIEETLDNILAINYENYKVYVLDDRSSDATAQKVEDYIKQKNLSEKLFLMRRNNADFPGKAAALNDGLKISQGDLVLVFDADAKVNPDCLKLSVPYFDSAKVGALQFQKRIKNVEYNALTLCQDLEFAFDTYIQLGRDSANGFVELRGSGQIISRACLYDIGGWDERSLTEDLEMSIRISGKGWKIRFAPEVEVYEEAVITPGALLKQRRRWSEGSLRRYLAHINTIFGPMSKMTFLQRVDIFVFISQFAVPVWVFLDSIVELIRLVNGQPTHLTTLMLASMMFALSLWINIIIAVRRWRGYNFIQALQLGTVTFFYGAAHWPMLVLWTMRKVIFGRRQSQWVKTPRMFEFTNKEVSTK
jgi:1,2-diacylglycerol 3-beta-glucosyltransferase